MFEDKKFILFHGDCLEIMDKLIGKGVIVDMILTDPPYGTTQCKWDTIIPFESMWERINKLIKPNGAILLFGNEPFSSLLRCSNLKNYKYDWYWDKIITGNFLNAKKQPMRQIETISTFYKKQCLYNPQMIKRTDLEYQYTIDKLGKKAAGKPNTANTVWGTFCDLGNTCNEETRRYKYPSNIISINKLQKECNPRTRFHPTQKPVELLEYLIKTYTNEGELVLDFTMGSGSTGVAALNTNRKFIGIELEEKYFEIAKNRMENN